VTQCGWRRSKGISDTQHKSGEIARTRAAAVDRPPKKRPIKSRQNRPIAPRMMGDCTFGRLQFIRIVTTAPVRATAKGKHAAPPLK